MKTFYLILFVGLCWLGGPLMLYADDIPGKLVETQQGVRPDVLFERFTSSGNGLPDNRIRSVFQDHNGFLWVGTMNGLCKYDGYTFKKYYKTRQANTISGNWVNAICEDRTHNLWIGTLQGVNYFDANEERFIPLTALTRDKKLSHYHEVTSLLTDRTGRLWIGSKKGLATYDPVTHSVKTYATYPLTTHICKIIPSSGDAIWIATSAGIVRYNTKTDESDFYALQVSANAYGERLWSLAEYGQDLYIATAGNGLIRLDYREKKQGHFTAVDLSNTSTENLTNAQIFDIRVSRQNTVWLATDRGLAKVEKLDSDTPRLTLFQNKPTNSNSLSDNIAYTVFIDKTDILWCGTEMGLNKLDLNTLPFRFLAFDSQQDQLRSLYTLDGNTIYFGTAKSGFYTYNLRSNSTKRLTGQPIYSSLASNRSVLADERAVWIGTLGGLIRLTDRAVVIPELKGAAIFALLTDSKGNTWAGTNNGLFTIKKEGTVVHYLPDPRKKESLKSTFIRSLYEDHKGRIWIGFENSGISYFDPEKSQFINLFDTNPNQEIFGSTIVSIIESPRNTIWIGSESGLNKLVFDDRLDQKITVKTYLEKDGLPDQSVKGILADETGDLWISTIRGIARFNPEHEHFQPFLPKMHFSASCCYKLSHHKLLFGGTNGFIIFDPQLVSSRNSPPEVVITDLKLFNKDVGIHQEFNGTIILNQSITRTNDITLGYKNNVFTLGFSGLHYGASENNRYMYKMEGFDQDWVYTSAENRSATYTNLNPGTYFFKVKAANNFGNWNVKPRTILIHILPPPWKTWWAIAIYVLLFNLLLFVFIRFIVDRSKQKQQLSFHQMERAQLESLNKMKLKFFTDISHEFRTPLSLIVGPVDDLLASTPASGIARRKLELINRNCKKMLVLINELMSFQKVEQGVLKLSAEKIDVMAFFRDCLADFHELATHKKIHFKVSTHLESCLAWIDPAKMEIVINNLLSNAFKFTPTGGRVNVAIDHCTTLPDDVYSITDSAGSWLCISVEDTGKGIEAKDISHVFDRFFQSDASSTGSGIGLSLAKNIVELHQGHITVSSEPGQYTRFTFYLPINESLLAEKRLTDAAPATVCSTASFASEPIVPSIYPFMSKMLDNRSEEKSTLLLVDDNYEVLEFLTMLFSDLYHIQTASSGDEALTILRKQAPDLLISDVMMPGMDGFELCRIVKDQVATFHIPVILLTAKVTSDDTIEGIRLGADDYVPKPFNPAYLQIRVEKLIEKQRRLFEKLRSNMFTLPDVSQSEQDDLFLKKVIEHVQENMRDEEFGVEELGRLVGMSRSNLFRRIKAITNQTPIEVICGIRLKHSIELLASRRMNVSEIAYEVGFKTPASFSKSFKKQFGKSPSEYLNDFLTKNERVC